MGAAFFAPGFEAGEPGGIGRIGGAGEEDFGRGGRNGEGHRAVGSDEGVAGFPFVGVEGGGAGEKEDCEENCRQETRAAGKDALRREEYAKSQKNSAAEKESLSVGRKV